jgi:hypothetical protein
MAKLQYEVAQLEAKTSELRANTALITQKTDTEQAKAENLRATTDQMNLDFVEQESGVKQERDLQKQQAQAHGNMALEVLKGHVKAKVEKKTTAKK